MRAGIFVALLAGCGATAAPPAPTASVSTAGSFYELEATRLTGEIEKLSAYEGKVSLIVNTASKCGFTGQYEGLQALHEELAGQGLVVLGFPSNEFGGQEPGSSSDIASFCKMNYGVEFPMFEKVKTKKGTDQHPVFAYLTQEHAAPSWNFTKYLVGRDGKVIASFPSRIGPKSDVLRSAIDAALKG